MDLGDNLWLIIIAMVVVAIIAFPAAAAAPACELSEPHRCVHT